MTALTLHTNLAKYIASTLCIIGLAIAASATLFTFLSAAEPYPYNALFRVVYFIAFASCLAGISYIFYLAIAKQVSKKKIALIIKFTIVLAILGLLVASTHMLVLLSVLISFNIAFPQGETYSAWHFIVGAFSALSCVIAAMQLGKLLFKR